MDMTFTFLYIIVFVFLIALIYLIIKKSNIKAESKRLNEMKSLDDNHEKSYRDFTEGHAYEQK